jgi:hypothetical protein
VDLLPDSECATISQWLRNHQEVAVMSRDRGGPYSKGGREGAPQAIQVADRFHLLMNLGDATKKMFQSLGKELTKSFALYNHSNAATAIQPTSTIIDMKEQEIATTHASATNASLELQFMKNLKGI